MGITLYNDDCLNILKSTPIESVDLICTDPPYRITARGCSGTMGGYITNEKSKKGLIFDNNHTSCKDYLPEFYRVLKDKSILYLMCNNINLQEMLNVATSCGFHFVKSLIWEKNNKICGRYYMGCFEYILMFRKGGDRPINHCGTPDILSIPIKKLKDENGNNLHDTEKPVELMKILVDNSSNEGEIVMDPFMGIGSTGIACVELKRKFIGCEMNPKYFGIAQNRINKANTAVRNQTSTVEQSIFD